MTAPSPDPLLPEGFPGLKLLPGERVLASLRPDLDESLRFSQGLVVLGSARLYVSEGAGFRDFEPSPKLTLRKREHAGLTELSFFDGGERVLRVHYTLALAPAGHDFETAFEATHELHGRDRCRPNRRRDEQREQPGWLLAVVPSRRGSRAERRNFAGRGGRSG